MNDETAFNQNRRRWTAADRATGPCNSVPLNVRVNCDVREGVSGIVLETVEPDRDQAYYAHTAMFHHN